MSAGPPGQTNLDKSMEKKTAVPLLLPRERSDSESLFDKLFLDEDDSVVAENFLKDLISASGLKGAWADLLRRMRQVEKQAGDLYQAAGRESLLRDFVQRKEYVAMVEETHENCLQAHTQHLGKLDVVAEQLRVVGRSHDKEITGLQRRTQEAERRLGQVDSELVRLEELDNAQHTQVMTLAEEAEKRCSLREAVAKKDIWSLGSRVDVHDEKIKALTTTLDAQQEFLFSDQLLQHIQKTCASLLGEYVHKEEVGGVATVATDHIVGPLKEGLHKLEKQLDRQVALLNSADAQIEGSLAQAHSDIKYMRQLNEKRHTDVNLALEFCAKVQDMDRLEIDLRGKLKDVVTSAAELQKECTMKFQECIDRLAEFQILLEDHEHIVQHHAEEMLNRATKFDLVVCMQRIEKCALKDKVDEVTRELQMTVAWQTAQLESMGYGQGFTTMKDLSDSDALPILPMAPMGRHAVLEASIMSNDSTAAPYSSRERRPPQSRGMSKTKEASEDTSARGATEAYCLIGMQLESLAQAVLGLGQLTARGGAPALPREVRLEREGELMHHLTSVVHWIMHKRAPGSWEAEKLATFALRSLSHAPEGKGVSAREPADQLPSPGRRSTATPGSRTGSRAGTSLAPAASPSPPPLALPAAPGGRDAGQDPSPYRMEIGSPDGKERLLPPTAVFRVHRQRHPGRSAAKHASGPPTLSSAVSLGGAFGKALVGVARAPRADSAGGGDQAGGARSATPGGDRPRAPSTTPEGGSRRNTGGGLPILPSLEEGGDADLPVENTVSLGAAPSPGYSSLPSEPSQEEDPSAVPGGPSMG